MACRQHSMARRSAVLTRIGRLTVVLLAVVLMGIGQPNCSFAGPGDDLTPTHEGDSNTIGEHIKTPPANKTPHSEPGDTADALGDDTSTSSDPCWYTPIPAVKGDPRLGGA